MRKILSSIKENEDSINNINTTIYSGKIRNNKELDALKIEIKTKSEFISNIDPKKELYFPDDPNTNTASLKKYIKRG